jgi:hypothetical protein
VPESYLERVKKDDPVMVVFPPRGYPQRLAVQCQPLYQSGEPHLQVSVRVPAGNDLVRPNLLSVLHVRDMVKDSAFVVPGRTIQEDVSGKNYVFVLENKDGKKLTKEGDGGAGGGLQEETPMIKPTDGTDLNGATIVDEGAKSVGDGQEVKVADL